MGPTGSSLEIKFVKAKPSLNIPPPSEPNPSLSQALIFNLLRVDPS
jgi:hypothetical protein